MSTLKVTNIQHASASTAAIALDSSGQATLNGLNFPTAGPLSNRNLIINGAMQVAQRGTSQASVSDGSNEDYQTLDRFGIIFAGGAGGVCTISQDTDVPSNEGFSSSYKVDVTTADTTIDATHYIAVYQKVEAQNVRNSGWNYTSSSSYLTLSFWAKSSKAGTYCVHARQGDVANRLYVFEYTLEENTWKKITHSIPGDSSAVFNNDNGEGLRVGWMLQAGSDRDDATAETWATSANNTATSNQVNFFDSTDNDFYLTGVQLEVGSVATPFEHRSYGDELARCQRYFQSLAPEMDMPVVRQLATSDTLRRATISHKVTMRVAPTASNLTVDSASSSSLTNSTVDVSRIAATCSSTGGVSKITAVDLSAEL